MSPRLGLIQFHHTVRTPSAARIVSHSRPPTKIASVLITPKSEHEAKRFTRLGLRLRRPCVRTARYYGLGKRRVMKFQTEGGQWASHCPLWAWSFLSRLIVVRLTNMPRSQPRPLQKTSCSPCRAYNILYSTLFDVLRGGGTILS